MTESSIFLIMVVFFIRKVSPEIKWHILTRMTSVAYFSVAVMMEKTKA